jgi:uracil-DNA glycosylase family 4
MRQVSVYPASPRLAVEECEPLDSDPSCERCSLHKRAQSVCMRPEIYGDRSKGVLLVVGQGPGEVEDRQGRPNVGLSGQYLRKQLEQRGRDGELGWPGAIVFDNAVRCMPGATKITPAMVKACRPYIHSALREALPSRILCLGSSAIQSIIGRSFPPYSVPKGYDFYRWATLPDTPVFLLPHPAAGLRNRFVRRRFEDDLAWALSAEPKQPPLDATALIIETIEDAEEAVADLSLAPTVTWDVETFGAPFDEEFMLLRLSVVPQDCRYAYVLEHDVLEHKPEVVSPILALLRTHPSGGQSVKLDCIALQARYGVRIENTVFDSHLYRRILDPDQLSRLEYAQAQIGMGGSKDEAHEYRIKGRAELRRLANKDRKKPAVPKLFAWMTSPCVDRGSCLLDKALERVWAARDVKGFPVDRYTYAAIPGPELTCYNAKDSISTDMIRSLLEGRLSERSDLLRVWEEVDRPLHYAITQMQFNGIAASREVAQQLSETMAAKLSAIKNELYVDYGVPEAFNPQAPLQVGQLLFETLKLPSKGRTAKSGQHKTSADVLEKLDHPVARLVVAYRQAAHFKSQYADGMQVWIQDDGRIHPSFKISGTEGSRPSCEDPNLLNIPRAHTPEGKLCRDIFVAPVPEYGQVPYAKLILTVYDSVLLEVFDGVSCWIVELDYSQMELRVAAMLSGDERMIQVFRDGKDLHLETARLPLICSVFKVNPATVDKDHPLRSRCKAVVFGTLYGQPSEALAAALGISKKQAAELQNAILGAYPKLREFIQERRQFGMRHGFCRTWWNGSDFRQRPLFAIGGQDGPAKDTAIRSTWNTPIQGTAAEYTNASLGRIQPWLDAFNPAIAASRPWLHSEMILPDVVNNVRNIMEGWPVMHDVPIKVDVKVGKSWGSMEDYDA